MALAPRRFGVPIGVLEMGDLHLSAEGLPSMPVMRLKLRELLSVARVSGKWEPATSEEWHSGKPPYLYGESALTAVDCSAVSEGIESVLERIISGELAGIYPPKDARVNPSPLGNRWPDHLLRRIDLSAWRAGEDRLRVTGFIDWFRAAAAAGGAVVQNGEDQLFAMPPEGPTWEDERDGVVRVHHFPAPPLKGGWLSLAEDA